MPEGLFSHPISGEYPRGKPLSVHTNNVWKKALQKYKGPKEYKKYLKLIAVFHDVGKANPHFQEYLFFDNKTSFNDKYKNHSYLSAVTLLWAILLNKDFFDKNYKKELLPLMIVLIAKHHGNLPDILTPKSILSDEELQKIWMFITEDSNTFSQYIDNAKRLLFKFKFEFELDTSQLNKGFFESINIVLRNMVKSIPANMRLEYFTISQYLFSCIVEADKRDASNNDKLLLSKELDEFNPKYFSKKLDNHYSKFRKSKLDSHQVSLNKERTDIKDRCTTNVRKCLKQNKRVFQIIAPTGSGKTLTFLSVASAIKNSLPEKGLKVIYGIPFLSITDQITKECKEIFTDKRDLIYRIDSAGKSPTEINSEYVAHDIDSKDTETDLDTQLVLENFAEHTFDHAFIVTTFVKVFETLTANKNKDLLRYNNFSKSIIILDEIQSLPPRTYTFLVGMLSKYAELFDAYIVIGSATVPMFELPKNEKGQVKTINGQAVDIREVFENYKPPINILDNYQDKYANKNFCRYTVSFRQAEQYLDKLADEVIERDNSTLCVLNTKKSSKELFQLIDNSREKEVYLLNTLQTLRDRRRILEMVKHKLKSNKKVILVSTQLIEAGIDISFPCVYRDLAPFPSIIQTAGRCNRSREVELGETVVTNLVDSNGKSYSSYVYKDLMAFTNEVLLKLKGVVHENELLKYQQDFFNNVKEKLEFGKFNLRFTDEIDSKYYLQHTIHNFAYNKLGQFTLIDSQEFDTVSVFVIQNQKDQNDYNKLVKLQEEAFSYALRVKIQKQISSLSDRIVSFPVHALKESGLMEVLREREIFGITNINTQEDIGFSYSLFTGLSFETKENTLII